MSNVSYSFKDNLAIDNSKYLKWLNTDGFTPHDVIGLDSNNNVNIVSPNSIEMISGVINVNSTNFSFINNVNFNRNIIISSGNYISSDQVSGGSLFIKNSLSTIGSHIELSNDISINSGHIRLLTNSLDSQPLQRFSINSSGTIIFTPDGSSISMNVNELSTDVNNVLLINNTTQSVNASTGSLILKGGAGISGDVYINGLLSVDDVSGNIDFRKTSPSINSTSGAIFLYGGLGIANTTDATSVLNGGGITNAGGFSTLRKSFFGDVLTILNTLDSLTSLDGSLVTYGGISANGKSIIRSNDTQLKLIPKQASNGRSSIEFHSLNNYSTNGVFTLSNSNEQLLLESSSYGNIIKFDNNINIYKDIFITNWSLHATGENLYINTNTIGGLVINNTIESLSFIKSANLKVDNSTFENIEFTDSITQNGIPHVSSQWAGTQGILTYNGTDGILFVGIGTLSPTTTFEVSGGTKLAYLTSPENNLTNVTNVNLISQNVTASNLVSEFSTITNILLTDASISNIISSTIISLSNTLSNINSVNATISNVSSVFTDSTNITSLLNTLGNIVNTSFVSSHANIINNTLANIINTSFTGSNLNSISSTISNIYNERLIAIGVVNTIGNITTNDDFTGINNSIPLYSLDISGDVHITDILLFENDKSILFKDNAGDIFDVVNVDNTNSVRFSGTTSGVYLNPDINAETYINFNNTDDTIIYTGTHASFIVSNENIGISASPTQRLVIGGSPIDDTIEIQIQPSGTISNLRLGVSYADNKIMSNSATGYSVITNDFGGIAIGTGTGGASSSRITITPTGFVGINNVMPSADLDISGLVNSSYITSDGATIGTLNIYSTENSIGNGSGGSVTILGGTSISKDLYVGGIITTASDIRLKENISDVDNVLDSINNIKCYKYNYKWDETKKQQYGFIAQELLNEFPLLVNGSDKDMYSVDYQKMSVILLKAIQELQCEIEKLKFAAK